MATATELNNEKFIVESSTEGEIFSAIAEIPGAGTVAETRNYQFAHHTPASGEYILSMFKILVFS